jgi:hypothetical protein
MIKVGLRRDTLEVYALIYELKLLLSHMLGGRLKKDRIHHSLR